MLHSLAVASDGIHVCHNWEVADSASRLALVVVITDIGKVCYQQDTKKFFVLESHAPMTWGALSLVYTPALLTLADATAYYTAPKDLESILTVLGKAYHKTVLPIAAGDEITAITVGVGKVTFRMPYAMTLESVKGSLTTAQTSGTLLSIDIKKGGATIFTTKPTFNNTSKTTVGATTPAVLSVTALADDDEITIDVSTVGDGTAKGLKVYLIGKIV